MFKRFLHVDIDHFIMSRIEFGVNLRFKKVDSISKLLNTLSVDENNIQFFNRHLIAIYTNESENESENNGSTSTVNARNSIINNTCTIISDVSMRLVSYTTDVARGGLFSVLRLKSVDLSGIDFSHTKSLKNLFAFSHIESITFAGTDTSNVNDMEGMFEALECGNLDITDLRTENVENMTRMFKDIKIKSIDFTKFRMDSVRTTEEMFYNASIDKVELLSADTSHCVNMSAMFKCASFGILDVSKFNTEKVTDMSQMFRNADIEKIDISSFSDKSLDETGVYNIFKDCKSYLLDISGFNRKIPAENFRGCIADIAGKFHDINTVDINFFLIKMVDRLCSDGKFFGNGAYLSFKTVNNLEVFVNRARAIRADVMKITKSIYCVKTKDNVKVISDKKFRLTDRGTGYGIFELCSFKTVELSDIDTTGITDLSRLFANSAIEEVIFGNLDTSKIEKMQEMFKGDIVLKSIKGLDRLNTSSVTCMREMFSDISLKELNLSSFDTSSVITMSGMFRNAKFDTLDISGFDTSHVEIMEDMFKNCKVKQFKLNKFNTSNVVNMSGMFKNLSIEDEAGQDLLNFSIGSFDTSKVQFMDNMFSDIKVKTLNIENFNFSSASILSSMFLGSEIGSLELKNIYGPYVASMSSMFDSAHIDNLVISNVNMEQLAIVDNMFANAKIKNLDISNFSTDSIVSANDMFSYSNIEFIDTSFMGHNRISAVSRMFNGCNASVINISAIKHLFSTNLEDNFSKCGAIIIDDGDEQYENEIKYIHITRQTILALDGAYKLRFKTELNLDKSVYKPISHFLNINSSKSDNINEDNAYRDLYYNLKDGVLTVASEHPLKLMNTYNDLVGTVGMFQETRFEEIDLTGISTSRMTDMAHMFNGCAAKSIILTGIDTSLVTSMEGMFKYCNLDRLDLSNLNLENVEIMREMFEFANIGNLIIKDWKTDKLTNLAYMFQSSTIENLDIEQFNIDKVVSMRKMFQTCRINCNINLDWIKYNRNLDVGYMFANSAIKSVSLKQFNFKNSSMCESMFTQAKMELAVQNKFVKQLKMVGGDLLVGVHVH